MNQEIRTASMIIAVIAFVFAIIVMIFRVPFLVKEKHYSWKKRITFTVPFLFISIFALRVFSFEESELLIEILTDSFLIALRTFLADGDIQIFEHFAEIDKAVELLFFGKIPNHFSFVKPMLKAVAVAGDIAAPVMTVTAVVSILSQFFQKFKIWAFSGREKVIFSGINGETVALVESLRQHYKQEKKDCGFPKKLFMTSPMLIITDTYIDDESEKSSEFLNRLKENKCVCVKDDILSLSVDANKKLTYILSDKDKMKNLSTAIKLAKKLNNADKKELKRQNYIYVFTDLEEAAELLSKECIPLSARIKDLNKKEKGKYELPIVIPIKEYKNAVYDLFDRLPLYTPLINQKDKKELNVTILGTGLIGTEAFLAAFWCGQMLDIKLNITVISLDATTKFKHRINRISKDILLSPYKPKPYCAISLISCDLKNVDYEDLLDAKIVSDNTAYKMETFGDACDKLYKTDYYIVSLGSDELNINAAYLLRRAVERAVLDKKKTDGSQVVIATSVYDDAIDETVVFEDENVKVFPFASFASRYSYENIINKRFITGAQSISHTYDSISDGKGYSDDDMKEIYGDVKKPDGYYKYWSNVARALHRKYVMFSAGCSCAEEIDKYINNLRDDALCDRLAWLEHRRWSAHLWTMGYKWSDTEKNLMEKKTQPCLVEIECGRHHKIPFEIDDNSGERVCTLSKEITGYDALDKVCCTHGYSCDTRQYDYPQHSGLRLNDDQMRIYLNVNAENYISSKENSDDYTYELYRFDVDKKTDQSLWEIKRILLDDKLKEEIDSLSKSNNIKGIVEYIKRNCIMKENDLMTWAQAKQMLIKKSN